MCSRLLPEATAELLTLQGFLSFREPCQDGKILEEMGACLGMSHHDAQVAKEILDTACTGPHLIESTANGEPEAASANSTSVKATKREPDGDVPVGRAQAEMSAVKKQEHAKTKTTTTTEPTIVEQKRDTIDNESANEPEVEEVDPVLEPNADESLELRLRKVFENDEFVTFRKVKVGGKTRYEKVGSHAEERDQPVDLRTDSHGFHRHGPPEERDVSSRASRMTRQLRLQQHKAAPAPPPSSPRQVLIVMSKKAGN